MLKCTLAVEDLEDRNLLATGLGLVAGLTDSPSALLTTGFYYDLLGRAPAASEVLGWASALQSGLSPHQEALAFTSSPEHQSNPIIDDYWNLLKRGPSPAEVNGWLQTMQAGVGEQAVEAAFLSSLEYYQDQGSNPTNWLSSLYQNVLYRTPSGGELASWNQVLQNGASRALVAIGFVNGPEAHSLAVTSAYERLLGRIPDSAGLANWVAAMGQGLTPSLLQAQFAASQEYAADQTVTPETPATFNTGSNPGLHFEFAAANSPVAAGYTKVPVVDYTPTRGYGWSNITGIGARARNTTNPLTSNFETGTDGTFLVDLPNGTYTVTVSLGDAEELHDNVSVWVNGALLASGLTTTAGQFSQPRYSVQATNGQLAFRIASQGSANPTFAIDALDIAPTNISALRLTPPTLASATVNSAYSASLSATGGSGTYAFAVSSGSLPSWLALNPSTGVLSGTPTTTGASTFTITATDSKNSGLTGSQAYMLSVNAATPVFPNNVNVPPLPAPTGSVVNISTVSQLQAAVANLQSGQTIFISPGTYNLTGTLYVPQGLNNISIRGATGKASDVVIKGDAVFDESAPYSGSAIWGPGSGITGTIPFGIWLSNVQGVTIADMTLQDYVDHAIILNAGVQSPVIHNVVMIDVGEQFIKSNPNPSGGGVHNGIVEYCTMEYTTAAPNNYTNGVDLHTTQNWIIRNNVFKNILTTNPLTTAGSGALAGPAVLVWNHSTNCTTENNTFINCQREIAYGLSDPSSITDDNTGGLIANNFIYRSGSQHGDVAMGVWNSPTTEVAYNTIILNGDYLNAVEYRFATTTGVKILYNLTDAAITARDGATATVTGNVSNAPSSWFVNESIGNLNLTSAATGAIGHGAYLPEVPTDYNGQPRLANGPTDVGAA